MTLLGTLHQNFAIRHFFFKRPFHDQPDPEPDADNSYVNIKSNVDDCLAQNITIDIERCHEQHPFSYMNVDGDVIISSNIHLGGTSQTFEKSCAC